MQISLITPGGARALTGNATTAGRWARLLGALGHEVEVGEVWLAGSSPERQPDLLIAIHAYRSAASIAAFRERFPDRPVVVLMAGTDIYRFQHTHPEETLASMRIADRLVGLHERVASDLPARFGDKLRVIFQSADPLAETRSPSRGVFDVYVIGHLRAEKDPLRAALAARLLPADSTVRVRHLGKAHDPAFEAAARAEMAANPRYLWQGEVPRREVRRAYSRGNAMVISSVMEGGANVVSEAIVAGIPTIASDISGNVGLLGLDHPAYYPVENTEALAALLERAEREPAFVGAIAANAETRRPLFEPDRERASWRALLAELG